MTIRQSLRVVAALLLGLAVISIPVAEAFVPRADRILSAIAKANVAGKRTKALQMNLTMRIGEGPPVARGELVTLASGVARLELKGTRPLVERHWLEGSRYLASRNGQRISEPRFFLPPLFVFQAASTRQLRADLAALGIAFEVAALAACGEWDCFVLGDASRVAPPQEPTEEQVEDPGQPVSVLPEVPGFARSQGVSSPPPTLWVDSESFDVRRLRTNEGVRVEFGPYVDFGTVRAPSWLQIEEPGEKLVRLDIQKVRMVTLPESEMRADWLTSQQPVQTELPVSPSGPASGFQEPEIR